MMLARKARGLEERAAWAEGGLTKWGCRTGNPGALPGALTHPLSLTVGFVQSRVLSVQTWCVAVLPRDYGWGWHTAAVAISKEGAFYQCGV